MPTPDEPDLTAAEFALGVLDGEERAAALRRTLSDPAFAREVERWRDRFGALNAEWPEVAAPAMDERRLFATVVANKTGERRWKAVAAFSGMAAALLLAVLIVQQVARRPTPSRVQMIAPTLVAVLTPANKRSVGIAIDPTSRVVRVGGAVATPAGRDAELWAIGRDGVPHAAGLLGHTGPLVIARDIVLQPGTTLAISIEPVGGSPKPTPTGPVLATGTLAAT